MFAPLKRRIKLRVKLTHSPHCWKILKVAMRCQNIQHNDTEQSDILQHGLNCDTQHKRDSAQSLNVIIQNAIMLSVVMLSVVMLSVVMLSVVMLSVVMVSVIMLSIFMLNVAFFYCCEECHNAE